MSHDLYEVAYREPEGTWEALCGCGEACGRGPDRQSAIDELRFDHPEASP